MVVGFTTICGDLFHYGHMLFLKQAKTHCDYLIVGLHSDEDMEKNKRKPILNITERSKTLELSGLANKVIINAPYVITDELLNEIGADIYIYATVNDTENQKYMENYLFTTKLRKMNYTTGISTSELIKRVKLLS